MTLTERSAHRASPPTLSTSVIDRVVVQKAAFLKLFVLQMDGDGLPREVRLVLLGHGGMGKSCLIWSAFQKKFVDEYDPTSAYYIETAFDRP